MTYDVAAVKYGTLTTTKSELFHDYAAYGEADGPAELAFYFWILRSNDRIILLDTGFRPAAARKRGRTCLHEPITALNHLGIPPATVDTVIISHFHYDHIGNADAFTNAQVIVPRDEYEFWIASESLDPTLSHHVEAEELKTLSRIRRQGRMRMTSGIEEILDGITAISVGGHSPGQQITVVETARGPLVLASDAVHFHEELDLGRPFSVIFDLPAMHDAYGLCRELVAERNAMLIPGHDPITMDEFSPIASASAGLAVRLIEDAFG